MRLIRNETQKNSLAKVFWDMGKVVFTILVISPLVKLESFNYQSVVTGISVGILAWLLGYLIDGREVQK